MKRSGWAWGICFLLWPFFVCGVAAQKGPAKVEWPLYGGNVEGWHSSTDGRINVESLKRGGLVLKWSYQQIPRYDGMWFQKHFAGCKDGFRETMQDTPEEAGGELFVATWHHLYAFDATGGGTRKDGAQAGVVNAPKWSYSLGFEDYTCKGYMWSGPRLAASATIRGVAVDKGVLYATTLDGKLIALDELSSTKPRLKPGYPVNLLALKGRDGAALNAVQEDVIQSYSTPAAPTVYRGKLIVGAGGGDGLEGGHIQGFVASIDAKTGVADWVFCTVPGLRADAGLGDAAGKELGSRVVGCTDDQSKAGTWPSVKSGRAGGGGVWTTPVVDPKDGLILFGTGNPIGSRKTGKEELHSAYTGDDRVGINLFTDSIVALDANGRLRSYYQEVHHDLWDYDQAAPLMVVRDKGLDVIGAAGKTGYWYEFDAKKFARNEDGAAMFTLAGGKETVVPVKPGYQRAWASQPVLESSYDFMMSRFHMWEPPLKPLKAEDSVCISPGTFGGAEWGPSTYDAKSGRIYLIDVEEPTVYASIAEGAHKPSCKGVADPTQSYIRAVDVKTGQVVPGLSSENLGEYPGGLLSTAGGLIFVGTRDGLLRAYGTDLKLVWSGCVGDPAKTTDCGFTVVAAPMSYTIKGKQYVAVTAMSTVPGGDSAVFVFGLPD